MPPKPLPKRRPQRPIGPAPDAHSLHEAALRYLARYATTQAGLLRVLARRVDRWAYAASAAPEVAGAAKQAARAVVERLVQSGVIDDAAFVAGRARSLARAGRSRRAIAAHLAAKGAPAAITAALPDDPANELAAAIAYASRRRMGPFGDAPDDKAEAREQRLKQMARMARAGFSQDVSTRALTMDCDEAGRLLAEMRRG